MPCLLAVTGLAFSAAQLLAQQQVEPGRNEFGQPDMEGFWSFASLTPLQRAEEQADKEFMTAQAVHIWTRY